MLCLVLHKTLWPEGILQLYQPLETTVQVLLLFAGKEAIPFEGNKRDIQYQVLDSHTACVKPRMSEG